MPLQNRINPFGGFDAVSARGAWLGNRGIFHNERDRRDVRPGVPAASPRVGVRLTTYPVRRSRRRVKE